MPVFCGFFCAWWSVVFAGLFAKLGWLRVVNLCGCVAIRVVKVVRNASSFPDDFQPLLTDLFFLLLCGCCVAGVSWVLVDVFAAGGDDAEDGDVDVADGWDDEGVLDADAVGEVAFGEGDERAAYDGGDHEAGAFAGEFAETGEAEAEDAGEHDGVEEADGEDGVEGDGSSGGHGGEDEAEGDEGRCG